MENEKNLLKYSLSRDGLLRRGEEIVTISRCFPWSEPLKWLSIRGADEKELDLIEDTNDLDVESSLAIRQAIGEAAFVLKIGKILDVEEQFELRLWTVELAISDVNDEEIVTRVGVAQAAASVTRRFQTKLNAWPRELPGGGVLMQDVVNDFYLVENHANLDSGSQKLLYSFLD